VLFFVLVAGFYSPLVKQQVFSASVVTISKTLPHFHKIPSGTKRSSIFEFGSKNSETGRKGTVEWPWTSK